MSNTRFPLHTSAQYSVGDNHMTEAHLPSRFATFERRLASQHLEDDAAESPHVHAAVDCYQAGGSEGQQGGMIDILALAAPSTHLVVCTPSSSTSGDTYSAVPTNDFFRLRVPPGPGQAEDHS